MVNNEGIMLFLIPILHQTTTGMMTLTEEVMLFLIPILHQTTTPESIIVHGLRCFSFQFYIKPQLANDVSTHAPCCFSFQFYIKPQLRQAGWFGTTVVSHSNSTSNHNLAHGSNSYSARYTYDTDA